MSLSVNIRPISYILEDEDDDIVIGPFESFIYLSSCKIKEKK